MAVFFSAVEVTVLQVGGDVEVIIHAGGLLRILLLWEVALQLLQLVFGKEVSLWEHHLKGNRDELFNNSNHMQLGPYI